jgi:hypothetical protein
MNVFDKAAGIRLMGFDIDGVDRRTAVSVRAATK